MTSDKTPAQVRQTILNVLHEIVRPQAVVEGEPLPMSLDLDEVRDVLANMETAVRIVNACDVRPIGGVGSYSVE